MELVLEIGRHIDFGSPEGEVRKPTGKFPDWAMIQIGGILKICPAVDLRVQRERDDKRDGDESGSGEAFHIANIRISLGRSNRQCNLFGCFMAGVSWRNQGAESSPDSSSDARFFALAAIKEAHLLKSLLRFLN